MMGFSSVIDSISEFFGWLKDVFIAGFFGYINFLKGIFTAAWEGIKSGFSSIGDGIKNFADKITTFFGKVGDIFGKIGDWFSSLWTDVKGGMGKLMENASGIGDQIKNFSRNALRRIIPDPNRKWGATDKEYWLLKAIPDRVIDWAWPAVSKKPAITAAAVGGITGGAGGAVGGITGGAGGAATGEALRVAGGRINRGGVVVNNHNGGNTTNNTSSNTTNNSVTSADNLVTGSGENWH